MIGLAGVWNATILLWWVGSPISVKNVTELTIVDEEGPLLSSVFSRDPTRLSLLDPRAVDPIEAVESIITSISSDSWS